MEVHFISWVCFSGEKPLQTTPRAIGWHWRISAKYWLDQNMGVMLRMDLRKARLQVWRLVRSWGRCLGGSKNEEKCVDSRETEKLKLTEVVCGLVRQGKSWGSLHTTAWRVAAGTNLGIQEGRTFCGERWSQM